MAPASAIVRRTLAGARIRDGCFALFFVLIAYANPVGYRHTYPTLAERLAFARSFGTNKAVELFYGAPHDLLTVGGFTAWRVGGFAAVITAIWGLLAAVRPCAARRTRAGKSSCSPARSAAAAPTWRRSPRSRLPARHTAYDAVILDRNLPLVHGDDVCRQLAAVQRRRGS
jgi:hypothetical protein